MVNGKKFAQEIKKNGFINQVKRFFSTIYYTFFIFLYFDFPPTQYFPFEQAANKSTKTKESEARIFKFFFMCLILGVA